MMNNSQQLIDREAVRETVTGVTHDIDQRRWHNLRARFADTVVVDYTSLFGGEVQTQNGDDLVNGWRQLLTPLTATQHLLSPICVVIHERTAEAVCHVRGYHHAKDLVGGCCRRPLTSSPPCQVLKLNTKTNSRS